MSLLDKWLYALKIKSWPKLLVPYFLGQCLGFVNSPEPSLIIFLFGFIFTGFLLGYIVLLNDYADINVDTIKRKLFPNDCSPKTIPDKILDKDSILKAGLSFGLLCMVTSLIIQIYSGKDYILLFSILCILVFAAYSLPPFRLNYRGGGEFLEMIGVGFMLPLFHYYLQAGVFFDLRFFWILILSTVFAFSSALASGLSDEESDQLGGKNTFVTLFGNQRVRQLINISIIGNYFLFLGISIYFQKYAPIEVFIFLTVFLLYHIYFILKLSDSALTNSFNEQRIYKDHIHKLILGSLSFLAIVINLVHFFKLT